MTPNNGPVPHSLQGHSPARTAKRLFLATRPMFFSALILPVILGTAWGIRTAHSPDYVAFAIALLAAVFAHAAINVINDVYDDVCGTDPINTDRIYPFTGGSRFIQEGIMTRQEMMRWGVVLLTSAALLGVGLVTIKGVGVIWFGLIGVALGVLYSVPPIQLSGHGLGEIAVGVGFGPLTVTGAAWLQSGQVNAGAALLSLPISFWVFNVLLINEIPDAKADAAAGRRTLVVRLGLQTTLVVYLVINVLAVLAIGLAVLQELLPAFAISFPIILLVTATAAAWHMVSNAPHRSALTTGIKTTLAIHAAGAVWLISVVWPW